MAALALTAFAVAVPGAVAVSPALAATASCTAGYSVLSQWPGGFYARIAISYLNEPAASWALGFDFVSPGQRVTEGWNGTWSQSGSHVAASSGPGQNAGLAPSGGITIDFVGSWAGSNPAPVNFTFDGTACKTPV